MSASDPYGLISQFGGADLSEIVSLADKVGAGAGAENAADPPPQTRSWVARPGDRCLECQRDLRVVDMDYVCPGCGKIYQAADFNDILPVSRPEGPGSSATRGRLRLVGAEAGRHQPALDQINPGDSAEQQKRGNYTELVRLNADYRSAGGNPFPETVLEAVAETYLSVQSLGTRRSNRKKNIIAALIYHSCVAQGFTRTHAECAAFAKLKKKGIAAGEVILRLMPADSNLGVGLDSDLKNEHLATVFAHLNLEGFEPLRLAILDVVQTAVEKHIGYRSVMRTKVVASTALVLAHVKKEYLGGATPPTVQEIAQRCQIRDHTIRKFLDEVRSHRSHFAPIFEKHNLGPLQ